MENNEILALPNECWRWVPGYEGWYQVSTRGRVRSVGRWIIGRDGKKRFWKGRILKPGRDKNGYLFVTLCRNGKQLNCKVHRLVAMAWLDNPEGKPEVNHLDENPGNPDVFNLEWATAKENSNWGTARKRIAASQSKAVLALDPKTGEVVLEFPSTCEAGRNGFDQGNISLCCLGKIKSHKGFVWRYKDDYDQENTWTPVKIGMDSQSKPVQAVDPETGMVVKEFPSIIEAQRNGFSSTPISRCCRGEYGYRTHRGFVWKFKDDYDQENAWTPVKIGWKAKPVQALDVKTGEVALEFPSANEAERNGFDSGHISKCCRGVKRYKTHKGYKWRYKP